uniref:Cation-transporting P-type ATPase N-terminal domain-containing protein n=1 Tax=Arcella intermedia TaxID=1963864 RepID=A0A6B2KWZ1_9EUKA|eukprot:TRINITY_DN4008_c0_g1_i1.p1 TRINITY_DN4008_c0_g1~~TRINITY_DN4008_c0_g1_i1.p1  ORF type:complete len:981 (-),score=214.23 TRINITY_DN4008_c0_g1_i1:48-2990(-)
MRSNCNGLTEKEVSLSREKFGSNELPPPPKESFMDKLKDNFDDPLIKILCVALGITSLLALFGYADWVEGIGIALAVLLATFVSTFSEYKNEETFQKLQSDAGMVRCNVFRGGNDLLSIPITEIVVGDHILLDAGALVPADGVLVHGKLLVNQQSLTGEPKSVRKIAITSSNYVPSDIEEECLVDPHLLFRGSVVDDGEGIVRITTVGRNTIYGKLAAELSLTDDRESPLQFKLGKLADAISRLGYFGAACIAVSFLFKQYIMDPGWSFSATSKYIFGTPLVAFQDLVNSVILAIIVIVVAVPEGLPMMIAMVLSLNMRKLLNDQVLVRKLLGIETAGSLSILFCDKTGTLTRGDFHPEVFITGNGDRFRKMDDIPDQLAKILAFSLQESTTSIRNSKTGQILGGNSSDRAMVSFLPAQMWLPSEQFTHVEQTVLFNSSRKFSATQVGVAEPYFQRAPWFRDATAPSSPLSKYSRYITVVKGAPEILLPNCTTYYADNGAVLPLQDLRGTVDLQIEEVSRRGTRVIVIATSKQHLAGEVGEYVDDHSSSVISEKNKKYEDDNDLNFNKPPVELTLVGIFGVSDQIRPNTKQAVQQCRSGGIKTVMITGDKVETAVSVAQEIGLMDDDSTLTRAHAMIDYTLPENGVLTSSQLRRMSDEQLEALLPRVKVIARALPVDKSRLVKIAQNIGHVVGMTGDGVNDSAALRLADVGFAMGSGAEVAKEAADIVILDDNFASIAKSILYGRTIFKSIRKFIVFQSTVNLSSTIIVFLGPFLGFDFPLSLIQLLWVNLVMDTFSAIAHGGSPPLSRYMAQNPIKREAPIINLYMWSAIIANGLFIALLCILFLVWDPIEKLFVREGDVNTPAFLTGFFCFFIFITNFNSFNVRTKDINIFSGILDNMAFVFVVAFIFLIQIFFTEYGGNLLRTVELEWKEWFYITGIAALIIPFDVFRKLVIVPHVRQYLKTRANRVPRMKGVEVIQ